MATTTKAPTVMFTAKSRDLVLTREPTREVMNGLGQRQPVPGTGLQYQFANNNLIVDDALEEKTRRYYEQNPDGTFAGMSALEWLRQHRLNGADENGIYEVTPVAPDPGDVLAQVALASADRDQTKLAELYAAEEEGWGRDIVLQTIEASLQALEGAKG